MCVASSIVPEVGRGYVFTPVPSVLLLRGHSMPYWGGGVKERLYATNAGRHLVSTPCEAFTHLCNQEKRKGEERFLRTSE